MEPLAAQSGRTLTTKPGLRRKRLHPGYDTRRYTQVRESRKSRHFGRDAENQAMEGNKSGKYSANPLDPTKLILTT